MLDPNTFINLLKLIEIKGNVKRNWMKLNFVSTVELVGVVSLVETSNVVVVKVSVSEFVGVSDISSSQLGLS